MKNQHILLANGTRTPYREVPELLEDASYDELSGFWRTTAGEILVRDKRKPPLTKKGDIETGEDQKGE
jgi:hypothetical protein